MTTLKALMGKWLLNLHHLVFGSLVLQTPTGRAVRINPKPSNVWVWIRTERAFILFSEMGDVHYEISTPQVRVVDGFLGERFPLLRNLVLRSLRQSSALSPPVTLIRSLSTHIPGQETPGFKPGE
jgi:hypothetical protein